MKNRQKGFANVLVIILVIVLVGVVGYMTWVKKSPITESPQTNNVQNTEGTSITTSSNVTQNQNTATANWKTYKDETYGFEFKYPSDWVIQKNDPYGWVVRKYPDYGFYLDIMHHPYTRGIETGVTDSNKLSSVDGHKALIGGTEEYIISSPPTQDSVYALIEIAPYSETSKVVTLSMDSNNHTKEMRKIFSNILLSFKFTKE